MMPFLHSLTLEVSMISFWSAPGIHQFTMYPDPLFSFAAMTKQASCGPKLVANMPAPQGHHVGFICFGAGQHPCAPYFCASMISRFTTACKACSSPGYEIFGTGGITQLPGSPMQP